MHLLRAAALSSLLCAAGALAPPFAHASVERVERPPPPQPPTGKGLVGLGAFGIAFGIFNVGYGIPLSITCPGDACFSGSIPIAFGGSFIVLGALGVHYGRKRRARWNQWAARYPEAALLPRTPRTIRPGVPLIIAGTTSTLAAVSTMIPMALIIQWTGPSPGRKRYTPTFAYAGTAFGAASTAIGLTLLTVGAVQLSRSRKPTWYSSAPVELTPVPWMRRDGVGLGLLGRF